MAGAPPGVWRADCSLRGSIWSAADLDMALCSLDFRDGAGRGGVREGNLGVCIFFNLSLGVHWGLPPFSSLFQPLLSILFTVQRVEAGWTDSPHLTTLIHSAS